MDRNTCYYIYKSFIKSKEIINTKPWLKDLIKGLERLKESKQKPLYVCVYSHGSKQPEKVRQCRVFIVGN